MKKINMEWILAAGMRAVRTMAQTALSMISIGAAISDIHWGYVGSVTLVSGLYSLLTSLATKLPEIGTDGVLNVDTSDPEKDKYLLEVDDLRGLGAKRKIQLSVKNPTRR